MRIAVLGDIGQPIYHVGDEAMVHAARHELGRRGHEPVLLTRDAQHTRSYFGPEVEVAPTLQFPWPLEKRMRYLEQIRDVLSGRRDVLPADDQIFGFLEAIESVDALVVAGGGNMNSRYGWLLFERVAAILAADRLGKRVFVTGQTIGPSLGALDAPEARAALGLALGVAARERATADLAERLLGPARVHTVLDDASFLDGVPLPAGWASAADHVPGAVVATFAPGSLGYEDELLPEIAAALDALGERFAAPVHLVPHMTRPGTGDGDEALHRRIAEAMRHEVTALPVEHALIAARRAREAAVVVTSRYHPAVFALDGGASVLGIACDPYTRVRLRGAVANWGLPGGVVLDAVRASRDELTGLAGSIAAAADGTRSALGARRELLRRGSDEFWDLVVDSLASGRPAQHRLVLADLEPIPVPGVSAAGVAAPDADAVDTPPPTVSVVVRTRNRPVMLARALDDIAAQAFDDLEVVVVNDGGDPEPVERLVAACHGLEGRVRILHRATSHGMEAASNAGIHAARGELLVIHDDDDTWERRFLAATVAYLRAHPDADAVSSRIDIVWEHAEESGRMMVAEGREPFHRHLGAITIADLLRYNRVVPIGLLYRRVLHEDVGHYDESLPVVGDWEFNMRLARRGPIPVIDGPALAFWHRRRASEDPALANSVQAQRAAHTHFDRMVRDERLREYLDREGDGGLLYLTWYLSHLHGTVNEKLDAITARLDALSESVAPAGQPGLARRLDEGLERVAHETREAGFVALVRRKYYRVRDRLAARRPR